MAQPRRQFTHEQDIPVISYPSPDKSLLDSEDALAAAQGDPYRIGTGIPARLDLIQAGRRHSRPDGGRTLSLILYAEGAEALALAFEVFRLPPGTFITLSHPRSPAAVVYYDHHDNPILSLRFATAMVEGDSLLLRVECAPGAEEPELILEEIAFLYRGTSSLTNKGSLASGSCEVNVNCSPEGDQWQDEKRGVARVQIKLGSQYYVCSGSLMINTAQDCTPYFLMAEHCGPGVSAADLNQWVFYFNYEGLNCSSTSAFTASHTVTGAVKRAVATNNIGSRSDMLLLELNQDVPNTYQPYFNGWDRSDTAVNQGVGIHHPAGDIKKISHFTTPLSPFVNTHWQVYWSATANGHGVTEGGSSGSPLFDAQGRVVGTLTGGYSSCSNLSGSDWYGKMSYHWDQNGAIASQQAKPWLDPLATGLYRMDGSYCRMVAAAFSASPTQVTVGDTVYLTDLSTGSPTTWAWTMPGGQPGSSSLQHPFVVYNTPGTYSIQLTASNSLSSDTASKTAYITVSLTPPVICDTLSYPLQGTPTLYSNAQGYPCGTNAWGDLAKAQRFDAPAQGKEISGLVFRFGAASGSGSVQAAIWPATGAGGSPGSQPVYSENLSLADIVTDVQQNDLTYVSFTTPVRVSGPYYAGVILPTASGAVLALVSNQDGQASPVNAWERLSSGAWYNFAQSYGGSLDIAMAIHPVVCDTPLSVPSPLAGFAADTQDIPLGYTVQFTDSSQGLIAQREWQFPGGTPDTSTQENPAVRYDVAGSYEVSLRVSGPGGSDSLSRTGYIRVYAPPAATFSADTLRVRQGGYISFHSTSTGKDLSYNWSFAGGFPSGGNDSALTIQYNNVGQYQAGLRASSPWGPDSDAAAVTVEVVDSLWGRVSYANASSTPLAGVKVMLGQGADSSLSTADGYYALGGLPLPGQTLSVQPLLPVPSGVVNSVDALLILQHFASIQPLGGLHLMAADVDGSGYVNATDAMLVGRYFAGLLSSFPAGSWKNTPVLAPTQPFQRTDLQAVATGDVNGSYH